MSVSRLLSGSLPSDGWAYCRFSSGSHVRSDFFSYPSHLTSNLSSPVAFSQRWLRIFSTTYLQDGQHVLEAYSPDTQVLLLWLVSILAVLLLVVILVLGVAVRRGFAVHHVLVV